MYLPPAALLTFCFCALPIPSTFLHETFSVAHDSSCLDSSKSFGILIAPALRNSMKFHPCCGLISLRSAIKITALIDLGLSIALFKIAFFALILIIPIKLSTEEEVIELGDEKVTNNDFIVIGIGITLTIVSCGLAVFLYFAAEKKNANHCKIWMGTTGALLVLDALLTWPLLSQIHISDVFIFGIIYAFAVYQFWLVFEFIEELSGDVRRKNTNNRGLVVCETDTAISDV